MRVGWVGRGDAARAPNWVGLRVCVRLCMQAVRLLHVAAHAGGEVRALLSMDGELHSTRGRCSGQLPASEGQQGEES